MPLKINGECLHHHLFQSKMTRCRCQLVIQWDLLVPILGMCIVQLSSIFSLSLSFVLIYTKMCDDDDDSDALVSPHYFPIVSLWTNWEVCHQRLCTFISNGFFEYEEERERVYFKSLSTNKPNRMINALCYFAIICFSFFYYRDSNGGHWVYVLIRSVSGDNQIDIKENLHLFNQNEKHVIGRGLR